MVSYELEVAGFDAGATRFIGEIEGVFEGTFISEEGERIEVTHGQFRVIEELPDGAVVVE